MSCYTLYLAIQERGFASYIVFWGRTSIFDMRWPRAEVIESAACLLFLGVDCKSTFGFLVRYNCSNIILGISPAGEVHMESRKKKACSYALRPILCCRQTDSVTLTPPPHILGDLPFTFWLLDRGDNTYFQDSHFPSSFHPNT